MFWQVLKLFISGKKAYHYREMFYFSLFSYNSLIQIEMEIDTLLTLFFRLFYWINVERIQSAFLIHSFISFNKLNACLKMMKQMFCYHQKVIMKNIFFCEHHMFFFNTRSLYSFVRFLFAYNFINQYLF